MRLLARLGAGLVPLSCTVAPVDGALSWRLLARDRLSVSLLSPVPGASSIVLNDISWSLDNVDDAADVGGEAAELDDELASPAAFCELVFPESSSGRPASALSMDRVSDRVLGRSMMIAEYRVTLSCILLLPGCWPLYVVDKIF